jgi:hypothetical protein
MQKGTMDARENSAGAVNGQAVARLLPRITPTRISIRATETPRQIETRLATNARPIQNAAMNQSLSQINTRSDLGRLLHVLCRPIVNHPHFLQRYQPALHHLVEHRQEGLYLLLAIHNLDDERQIH